VPPQRQRILPSHQHPHGDHPRRQRLPAPATIEDPRDQIFTVLEDMRQEQRQRMDRQDQVLNLLLTHQQIPIPTYFIEPPPVVPPPEQPVVVPPPGPVQDPAGAAQILDPQA
jgi:hypothetical protein